MVEKETTILWGREGLNETKRIELINQQIKQEDTHYDYWYNIILERYKGQVQVQYDRRLPWKVFAEFISTLDIAEAEEYVQEHHSRSIFYHCEPCDINYSLITHLELSKNENEFIFNFLNLNQIKSFGKSYKHHLEFESDNQWKTLKRDTLKGIYRYYWLDFILLGYSTDQVLKIINFGLD